MRSFRDAHGTTMTALMILLSMTAAAAEPPPCFQPPTCATMGIRGPGAVVLGATIGGIAGAVVGATAGSYAHKVIPDASDYPWQWFMLIGSGAGAVVGATSGAVLATIVFPLE
jgi:hypothetical protein